MIGNRQVQQKFLVKLHLNKAVFFLCLLVLVSCNVNKNDKIILNNETILEPMQEKWLYQPIQGIWIHDKILNDKDTLYFEHNGIKYYLTLMNDNKIINVSAKNINAKDNAEEIFNIRAEFSDDDISTTTLFDGTGYMSRYNKTNQSIGYKSFPSEIEGVDYIINDDGSKFWLPPEF